MAKGLDSFPSGYASTLPPEWYDKYGPAREEPVPTQHSQSSVITTAPEGSEQITIRDGMQWMSMPSVQDQRCLPGLACLSAVDQLVVKQKKELLEAITGFETRNKYEIKNSSDELMFFALEESDSWSRYCCGNERSFDMKILDRAGNEVIHLFRPFVCNCFTCTMQSLDVSCPPGTAIGTVLQEYTFLNKKFLVQNTRGQTLLSIEQPFYSSALFQIMSADGTTQVGKISKQWGELFKEMFTDADSFGVSFPTDADVKTKALLLGAVFLIDFLFFES